MRTVTDPDENDISSFNSHVSSRPNSNANVGLSQSRRVVDTITDHCHRVSPTLQLLHLAHLLKRQGLRIHCRYANLLNTMNPALSSHCPLSVTYYYWPAYTVGKGPVLFCSLPSVVVVCNTPWRACRRLRWRRLGDDVMLPPV